jgi:probable F420-dependent oxidoreductase
MEFWHSVAAVTELDQLIEIAKIAEEVGFTGVAVADHLATPLRIGSRYPYSADGTPFWGPDEPFLDPWVLIAAMAAETTRLRFLPYVYVVPLRDPFHVAKAVSSAAVLSGDRVVLGAGVGWMREEFALAGQPFEGRGPRTDEMLEVVVKLLGGRPVEHHGRFYDFGPVQMAPAPRRRVEVRVGGTTPAALRRASRHDGWLGLVHPPDELERIVAALRELRARADRLGEPFDVMIAHHPTSADRGEYERYRDAGATSIHVPPWRYRGVDAPSLDQKRRSLEAFAERYIVPLGARGRSSGSPGSAGGSDRRGRRTPTCESS